MRLQCQGKISIPKRLINEGVEDSCHNFGYYECPKCKGKFCHNHQFKHNCGATADNTNFKTASPKLKHS